MDKAPIPQFVNPKFIIDFIQESDHVRRRKGLCHKGQTIV